MILATAFRRISSFTGREIHPMALSSRIVAGLGAGVEDMTRQYRPGDEVGTAEQFPHYRFGCDKTDIGQELDGSRSERAMEGDPRHR